MTFKTLIEQLVDWLNKNRSKNGQHYAVDSTPMRYWRIVAYRGSGDCVCGFVSKEHFINKTMGPVKAGDILYPKSWSQPAAHARGNLWQQDTWEDAFDEYGVKAMKTWRN